VKRLRALLGTYVEIAASGPAEADLERAIDAAFQAVELVHRLMSAHQADSDLSRVNRLAWREAVEVHPWTMSTLRWAKVMHGATDGLFDCAVGHELVRRGFLAGCGFEEAEQGSLGDLEIARDGTVRLARRIGLDLGGIAKGFAVDRAIATLRRRGVRAAVVNAGGDLRVLGDQPQPVWLRDPGDSRRVRFAGSLAGGAMATSGVAALVHGRTRTPVVDANSYSVLAPRCVIADALAKVVAQTGRTDAPCLDRFGATALVATPRHAVA
jgi:thiamine biosynthesis lipoprotein